MSGVFADRENMQFAAIEQQVTRTALTAMPMAGVTILLVVCALLSGGVEYAISYELFAYFKAPLPGEESQWSVALLALTGVLMALALHLHASEHPDSFAVRVLRQSVSVLVPLYAIGAGLALAAILYFDGADALFNANATAELFATAAQETGSSLISALVSNLSLIFVLGCGGLAIINLYIFHKLLSLITANTTYVTERVLAAREARETMQTIQACDQQFAELSSQREILIAQNPRLSEFAFANHIVSVIHQELAQAERWMTGQQFRLKPPENRFVLSEQSEGVDLKEVQKRITALRAINAKTIAAAFRSENEPRSKP